MGVARKRSGTETTVSSYNSYGARDDMSSDSDDVILRPSCLDDATDSFLGRRVFSVDTELLKDSPQLARAHTPETETLARILMNFNRASVNTSPRGGGQASPLPQQGVKPFLVM